VTSVKKDIK